ncbi:MAG: hypothetical protein ACLFTI_06680 [Anaerolineales bacterium]
MPNLPGRDQLAWLASFPDENPNPVLRFGLQRSSASRGSRWR